MGNLFEFHFRMQIFNGFLCRSFHFVSFVKRKLSHTNMQANCLGLGARSFRLDFHGGKTSPQSCPPTNPPVHPPTGSLLGSSLRFGVRNNWNKFAISAQTFCWPTAHTLTYREKILLLNLNAPQTVKKYLKHCKKRKKVFSILKH